MKKIIIPKPEENTITIQEVNDFTRIMGSLNNKVFIIKGTEMENDDQDTDERYVVKYHFMASQIYHIKPRKDVNNWRELLNMENDNPYSLIINALEAIPQIKFFYLDDLN